MDCERLFMLAEQARGGRRLAEDDARYLCETLPEALAAFPKLDLPARTAHPAGFALAGAPVGTFVRAALLLAGRRALGPRYGGHGFYERVESDLALRIMRSNFHGGAPKGAYCCPQCTLAVLPVLEADAIRWFDGRSLAAAVRAMISARAWRFAKAPNAAMLRWALGEG